MAFNLHPYQQVMVDFLNSDEACKLYIPMGRRTMPKMKSQEPTEEHKKARLAMLAALKAFNLTPMEMLGVMSYTLGQLIALQDQRRVTPSMAMEVVSQNIEKGNQDAIDGLLETKGSC